MRQRPYLVFFLLPVLGYLTVLFVVAVLVLHPSALGWIGLGVAATAGLLIATGVSLLFPRARTNAPPRRAPADGGLRLLVVADLHCDETALCGAVRHTVGERSAEVFVVAPVLASPLHFLTNAEDAEAEDARGRLDEALLALRQLGIQAHGAVGTDDPLQAIGDALASFPADEILLAVREERRRTWLEHHLERRVRDSYGVHVSTLTLDDAPAAAPAA